MCHQGCRRRFVGRCGGDGRRAAGRMDRGGPGHTALPHAAGARAGRLTAADRGRGLGGPGLDGQGQPPLTAAAGDWAVRAWTGRAWPGGGSTGQVRPVMKSTSGAARYSRATLDLWHAARHHLDQAGRASCQARPTAPRARAGTGRAGATREDLMNEKDTSRLEELRARWQERYAATGERDADFTTLSGEQQAPLYTSLDHPDRDEAATIGVPGQYPYTRGVHPTMYRGRPWTIRQFSGFGNARETNARYRYLIAQGGGGLSVAFDMPTLMGRDSDDPRSAGE